MIEAIVTGRLVKAPVLNDQGRYDATVALEDDSAVRLVCGRRFATQLADVPHGVPVSVSGRLLIRAAINKSGEPYPIRILHVGAVMALQPSKGLMARLFQRGE